MAYKKLPLLLLGIALFYVTAWAEDWVPQPIGPFSGINNRDNSYTIPAEKSQDALNVDITPGGKSVKKRKGLGTFATLQISTSPVHGVYNFFDSNGNDISLFFNDNRVSASSNGSSPSVIMSTGSNGATWQCTDSLGFAYCVNTGRQSILKTDGLTNTNVVAVGTGTMITVTPDRLVLAGFANAPSRIDFSKAGDFTTWTAGSNATDPTNFTISAPGSRITHIVYAFGRVMWFKDSSFGFILIGNQPAQSDWVIKTVSYDVGTNDNTSIYREGILYFRGQDGHMYAFDGSNYQRISDEISGTVNATQRRTSGSWTQTTQSDFEAGFSSADITTSQLSGSVMAKTTSYTYPTISTPTFSGSTQYVDTTTVSGVIKTIYPDQFDSFLTGSSGWSRGGLIGDQASVSVTASTLTMTIATSGSFEWIVSNTRSHSFGVGTTYYVYYTGISNNASARFNLIDTQTLSGEPLSSGDHWSVSLTRCSGNAGFTATQANSKSDSLSSITDCQAFPLHFYLWLSASNYRLTLGTATVAGTHTMSNDQFYSYIDMSATTGGQLSVSQFAVSPQTFTFTSGSLDTGIAMPVWSTFTATYSGDGSFTSTSEVSSDNSIFDSAVSAPFGSKISSAPKRYIKTTTLFNQTVSSGTKLSATYTLLAGSSGTYLSAIRSAPSLTSWDSFGTTSLSNDGSQTFYIRSSSNTFTVQSSTPNWTQISDGAIPTVSTGSSGVHFQIRNDLRANSNGVVRMDDFTQNWLEGLASDKMYATYFDKRLWFSVTSGTGATTNNRIMLYDMLNQTWLLYDIAANGFLVRQNRIYLGSANTGTIYKYGDTDNDAGSAINSYWKSKDFFGASPFSNQEIANISIAAKSVQNSSMTVTYTLNGSSVTSYTMNQYKLNSAFINNNRNLPAGTVGNQYNIQFGNNAADQYFEVFGIQIGIRPKSWIPQ